MVIQPMPNAATSFAQANLGDRRWGAGLIRRLRAGVAIAAAIAAAFALPAGAALAQGTLIDRVNGYTMTSAGALVRFEALAFDAGGRVIWAGSSAEAAARAPGAQRIDGGGRTLLTGLIDAHGHVMGQGVALTSLDLNGTKTLAEAQTRITEYARRFPANAWVRGGGWNQVIWQLGRFPTAAELDKVVADRPAWLRRVDGHAGWANARALKLAGITRDTADPVGGRIERDARGEPSGVLVDAAMDLMAKVLPAPSEAELRQALDAALASLREVGLTSVHDMGLTAATDRLFREYADAGRLTTRIHGLIGGAGADFDQLSAKGPVSSVAQDLYALRGVKLYADGALGSRGAALLAPYSDMPGSRGLLFQSKTELTANIEKALKKGYAVSVHAIGDAGNRQVLDAFADLSARYPVASGRHRVEHVQVVALEDIPRFKSLGIIPSMQPTHATSDMNMAEDRVGAQRIQGAYAWRRFLLQGSPLACGSDFPVESANPFLGLHAAVMRESEAGMPLGGWYLDQGMSLKEAFRCFTLDAAYAARQEAVLGTLEPGKWADFIVIDQDLFRMNPHDIWRVKVLQTWVGGRQVFSR
jgi:predicted amidohydrolase YtcJ